MSDVDDEWRRYASHVELVAHAADTWLQLMVYQAAGVAGGAFAYEDAPLLKSCLPPVLEERYDAPFLARFALAAGDLAARVQKNPMNPWPSCVAEELALVGIASHAEVVGTYELASNVAAFDLEEYLESTMQDDDVRLLWDRIGRRAVARAALDFVNLDFSSWFVAFRNATFAVAQPPPAAEIARWIEINSYSA